MKILYDGWPLVYGGDDPAALHLLTLLAAHPASLPAALALPGPPFHAPPGGLDLLVDQAPDTTAGRLRWEQRTLPALARRASAGYIHTTGGLALFGSAGLLSPTGFFVPSERPAGLAARLGSALAYGGAARARAWLWPADLPVDGTATTGLPPETRKLLPAAVHPAFSLQAGLGEALPGDELARLDLPESFILVHSPGRLAAIDRILAAWSWAAGSIGVDYPLLWVGLKELAQETLAGRLAKYGLTGTARPLPPVSAPALAELYRRCSVVLCLDEFSPWSGPARLALASARPLAAYETPGLSALAGPAAYLAAPGQDPAAGARAMGAALLTIVVEEGLADALSNAARQRAQGWSFERFRAALEEFYTAL